jgi:uncharacterized protein YecE (DUF72 family)
MAYIGAASWRLAKSAQARFQGGGTHLARYGHQLGAVEVNSSFYRHHRRSQYAKWATEVPADFRFAVKLPRWLTHQQRLADIEGLDDFLAEVAGLGDKLGPLLAQLPPSLVYDADTAADFFEALRHRFDGGVVVEPRHSSWFCDAVGEMLARYEVARVAADPPPVEGADVPGGFSQRVYFRLHGRPRRFYSAYSEVDLERMAERLRAASAEAQAWCIFNNTATEAGLINALDLTARLGNG